MIRQWEEFEGGPYNASSERLHITLNRKGDILLNENAFETLGRPEAVVLLFDRRHSTIGIKPAQERLNNAFPIKAKQNVRHRLIHASTFCRHYGIKVERTIAFNNPEPDNTGVLLLDLRATTEIGKAVG